MIATEMASTVEENKDSELVWRQQQIDRLEGLVDGLTAKNNQLRSQLESAQQQNEKDIVQIEVLQASNSLLKGKLSREAQDEEKVLLLQQVEAYKREAAEGKGKAESQAEEAWRIHCDQVTDGRKVNEAVIKSLRDENGSLREENERLKAALLGR